MGNVQKKLAAHAKLAMKAVRAIRTMRASAAILLVLALTLVPLLGGCGSNSNAADNAASSESDANASADKASSDNSGGDSSRLTDRDSTTETHDDSAASDSSDSSHSDDPAEEDRGDSPPPGLERGESSQYDDSKPGQLTAGEWNDTAEWKGWLNLLQSGEGQENTSYWSFYPERRLEVDVVSDGKPVADAAVTLTRDDGEAVWEARTNNEGIAYVYAGLYDEQGSQDKYGVSVSFGDQLKRYGNVPVPRAEALKVELEQPVKTASALDLMLLVDTTGSMGDELDYLKTELKDVVKRVDRDNGQQLAIRVSANFYRDRGDDYVVKPFAFTDDVDKAVAQLSDQHAAGGGDFPEAVDRALENAIDQHEWSDDARARLLFLVMDAPPHHERKVTKRIQELTEEAAADGIRIIPVASSGVDVHTEYLMRFMAAATGGTYLLLTDHSGIGGDHLEPATGIFEVKALNDLLVNVINRYAAQ
ncbi:VWA domain-containing protein [Paenibacillus rhizovicinus]|uniref:VWA domain-containing protein n=1 Tax=Paenibacillus rhizovicinus TaxID=2704463 RepID=A0A6C0P479_9BACL|nr:VWA domain-containing protein [Paenibacillus rhizovicinus]QHW33328.1 VWA domain-containing protein [Paenibacillus rhizovicinus]